MRNGILRAQLHSISPSRMPRTSRVALLFVRVTVSSITPASRCRPLPGRCHQVFQTRGFSLSSRRHTPPSEGPAAWTNIPGIVRPSAMWLAPKGSKFDQQQVLDQLPRLGSQGERLPVVLLLVTPKLAHLLENDHPFYSRAINSIYGDVATDSPRQSVVAVVDALPILGQIRGVGKPEVDGTEGIAMCVSSGFDVLPVVDDGNSQPLIRMTGKHPFFDGQRYLTISYAGGVANTTFINGRQHTLFMQTWSNRDGSQWAIDTQREDLSSVNISIYGNRNMNPLPMVMYSKMIKLTDPKVIVSSMGNIVRQVKTSERQELAASHELEKIVPKMLKELQKDIPTGDLRVFALVYPAELGDKDVFVDRIWKQKPDDTAVRNGLYNLNLLSLIAKGARLYRVTSGGAGWGKKAGLLSLEPITKLGTPAAEPAFPFFVFQEAEDIRMPGSADLFPPGYVIQFIGTFHDTEGSKKDAVSINEAREIVARASPRPMEWNDAEKAQQFCLGNTVLPETHAYTSLEDVESNSADRSSSHELASQNLIFRPHRFGFLTSSALGISAEYHSPSQKIWEQAKPGKISFVSSEPDVEYSHSSLIELPNSYFVAKFPAGDRVSAEAVRNLTGSESSDTIRDVGKPTTLTRGSMEDDPIVPASQELRNAERLRRDSHLAKDSSPVRKVMVVTDRVIRNVTQEKPPALRSVKSAVKVHYIEMSFDEWPRTTEDLHKLSNRKIRRMKRRTTKHVMYRSRNSACEKGNELPGGSLTSSQAASRSVRGQEHIPLEDSTPVYRWTPSTTPREEYEGSPPKLGYRWVEYDPEDRFSDRVQEQNERTQFRPFGGLRPGVRRVTSVLDREKHDMRGFIQESSIFRVYDSSSVHFTPDDDVDSKKRRQAVEQLTADL